MKETRGQDLAWLSPAGTARRRLVPDAPDEPTPELRAAIADAGLGEESLYLAWQVGAWAPELSAAERRSLQALVARSLMAVSAGSTRLPLSAAEIALLARVPQLAGDASARRPLVIEDCALYQQRLFACEARLATAVRARLEAAATFTTKQVQAAMKAVLADAQPRPSDEQAQVVSTTLQRRFTVVSGGPGTGKTTIVLALLRALVRLGIEPAQIALAAPTGKAAQRLDDAARSGLARLTSPADVDRALGADRPAAQTLHRLLGYAPSTATFRHHDKNPIGARVVIVDEGSMVDLFLMDRLFRALDPDTTLVLLGDADQLPSVDAGAVFRDLVPLGVRLTKSFRMDPSAGAGRRILELATQVRTGAAAQLSSSLVERRPEQVAFEGVELVAPAGREALLERWYAERIGASPDLAALTDRPFRLAADGLHVDDPERLEAAARHLQRFRLLGVTRGRASGVEALNAWMHRRAGGGARLAPGEPVLVLRNDYDRGLWNGDQGLVVLASRDGRPARPVAAFPVGDRWAAWDLGSFRDQLDLAYALTVHKAQGSEFDEVLFVLPDAPLPLLSRELIYTALTRARRSVVVSGELGLLGAGVAATLGRSSGLSARIGLDYPAGS